MKIFFLWGAGNDTGEACSPLFPIEDPPSRSTQTCLDDLISDVKQGARVLCLSPVALLETIGPFPRLHGAWCNSIFFLTAGKENQVIKCEKSPAGGPFLLGWISQHCCPSAKARNWPGESRHGSGQKHDTAHECTAYQTQFVVRNWQASHVQLKWPYFPSAWKGLPVRRLWSQCYALCSWPHCPRTPGPGQEASPPH